MIKLDEFDFAVLDCDGVILDSNPIKTDAFRHSLAHYPKTKVDDLVAYHREHGGVSRYEKFHYFFESLIQEFDEASYAASLKRFQEYCQSKLREAMLVPGVLPLLERLKVKNIPAFVVSGSDETEVREVLRQKALLPFFQQVLGSPVSKRDNLKRLLEAQCPKDRGVFFGDARLDYEIATENGLAFVFVYQYSEWAEGRTFCAQHNVVCIPDFQQLPIFASPVNST